MPARSVHKHAIFQPLNGTQEHPKFMLLPFVEAVDGTHNVDNVRALVREAIGILDKLEIFWKVWQGERLAVVVAILLKATLLLVALRNHNASNFTMIRGSFKLIQHLSMPGE